MKMISVGYGNMINAQRVIAVVSPDSAPMRRLVQEEREDRRGIDATCGKRTKAVLVMDSGHLILSPLQTETIAARINDRKNESVEDTNAGED